MSISSVIRDQGFCDVCTKICGDGIEWPRAIDRFRLRYLRLDQTFDQLRSNASRGCRFCQFRYGLVGPDDLKKLELHGCDHHTCALDQLIEWRSSLILEYHLACGDGEQRESLLCSPRISLKSSWSSHLRLVGLPGTSTASPESAQQMNTWLGECDHTHNLCQEMGAALQRHAALPTRLLDVYLCRVVLCEEEHLPATTRYVTLSHCWGQRPIEGLRMKNLGALTQRIDPSALPQSFQDAFCVTRSLSVRYLWIDNLCIIQDSHEDWQRESALMCQVYENAYACVAATKAEDSSQGLFSAREPGIYGHNSHFVLYAAWGSPSPQEWVVQNIDTHEHSVGESVLCRRGWVLQERILSRRVIHFAEKQLFWECPSLKACESAPEGFGLGGMHPSFKQKPHILDHQLRKEQWRSIIRDYMNAALTYPSKDTVVAISGVAQRSGPASEYWAGLWTADILEHLCWRYTSKRRQRSNCGAPTWSWMSVIGSVELGSNNRYKLAHFRGGTHPFEDLRRFSFVTGVKLFFEAPLKLFAASGWWLHGLNESRPDWCNNWPWKALQLNLDLPVHLPEGISEGPLYCMFVYKEICLHGLLVEKRQQPCTYERRGSFYGGDLDALSDLLRDEDSADLIVKDRTEDGIPLYEVTLV